MTVRIIVSDSSCLIDLQKTRLMEAFLGLPYEMLIPDVMFETELLSIPNHEKQRWQALGMQVEELSGDQVLEALVVRRQVPALSDVDCFAYTLARHRPQSVLFTGDSRLTGHARTNGVEAHGLIWGLDLLREHQACRIELLKLAAQELLQDPLVRLPPNHLEQFLRRLT